MLRVWTALIRDSTKACNLRLTICFKVIDDPLSLLNVLTTAELCLADSTPHPYLQETPPYSSQTRHRNHRRDITPEPVPLADLSDPYTHDSIYLSPQLRPSYPSYPSSRQYNDVTDFDSNPYSTYAEEMMQPSPPYDAYGHANTHSNYQVSLYSLHHFIVCDADDRDTLESIRKCDVWNLKRSRLPNCWVSSS